MSRLRLTAALLAASALLGACSNQDDVIESEPADPTSDQSTNPPAVDTDPPADETDAEA